MYATIPDVDDDDLVAMCRALGDPTRARIFAYLLGCCGPVAIEEDGAVRSMAGATVGEVCCHVTGSEAITSNVSFHLKTLREAGLLLAERHGRHIVHRIDYAALARLAAYFDGAKRRGGCA